MPKCPKCGVPLCATAYEGVRVQVCPECRGTLVESPCLRAIERRRERHWTGDEQRRITARVMAGDAASPVRCPKCLMYMEKVRASRGGATFHLDRCAPCDAMWLDRGELDLVQIQYEQEIDGRTPEDWDRIERAARAELRLKEELRQASEAELDSAQSVAAGLQSGPIGVAVVVAREAAESLQEGMQEEVPVRRRWLLTKALLLALVAILFVLIWYYLGAHWGLRQ